MRPGAAVPFFFSSARSVVRPARLHDVSAGALASRGGDAVSQSIPAHPGSALAVGPTLTGWYARGVQRRQPTDVGAGPTGRPGIGRWSRPSPGADARCRAVARRRYASPILTTGRSEEHTSELQSHVNLVC